MHHAPVGSTTTDHTAPSDSRTRTQVDHLLIFISVVMGFVVSEYLVSGTTLVVDHHRAGASLLQMGYLAVSGFLVLLNWWLFSEYRHKVGGSLFHFVLLTLPALLFALIHRLIVPPPDTMTHWADYFAAHGRAVSAAYAVLFTVIQFNAILFRVDDRAQDSVRFHLKTIMRVAVILLNAATAVFFNWRLLQVTFVVCGAMLLVFICYAGWQDYGKRSTRQPNTP